MNHPPRDFDIEVSDRFWSVIDQAQQDKHRMMALLEEMSQEDLADFYSDYDELHRELIPYRQDNIRGYTEDDLNAAASWVLAQGKDQYLSVWHNLDLIPDPKCIPFIDYGELAAELYKRRYGNEIM